MIRRNRVLVVLICVGLTSLFLTCQLPSPAPRYLNPADRSDDRPFSHAVVVGNTIYLAGTLGIDPETGDPPEDSAAEARLMLDGFKRKLELAGATMDDLVQVQVFCSDLSLYPEFNEIYGGYFDGSDYPVRAFIGSGPLLRGARYEINGIAVKR